VFRRSKRGPLIPGFRYLLDRYFVMSPVPDERAAALSILMLAAMSDRPAWLSLCPKISQNMPVGWHTAWMLVPFFVHLSIPRSESIDFSHDGSLSTSHLGIRLLSCITLMSFVSQFIVCV